MRGAPLEGITSLTKKTGAEVAFEFICYSNSY